MQQPPSLDIVDVHLSSQKDRVDALFIEPLLDNTKKYTVEVAEFQCSLHGESAMPPLSFFKTGDLIREEHLIMRVRRRYVTGPAGTAPGHVSTLLTNNAGDAGNDAFVAQFQGIDTFIVDETRPCQNSADLLYYLQRYFDDIKAKYVGQAGGVDEAIHGGDGDWDITADENFVKVEQQPNGCFRLYFAPNFCKNFWCELSDFGANLLGFDSKYLSFSVVGGNLRTGWLSLTGNAQEGLGTIIAGTTGETIGLTSSYPLDRNFDHRVSIELATALPIPPTVTWSTNETQQVAMKLASWPINNRTRATVVLNNEGTPQYCYSTSPLLTGDIVWRRAEDKVSEKYMMLNSQFVQNIRLTVYIFRREWNRTLKEYKIKRLPINLLPGDSWTAKLRFRTM